MITPKVRHPHNVLLAYDGSEHSRAAVSLLCDLPLSQECSITALSVFTPLQVSDHERLQSSLKRAQDCLIEKGLAVESEFILGYPAEKVIEFTEKHEPDLIVLGAKGLRATLGILLGGVAQQVVEYACCPVLVVRAPYDGWRRILLVTDGSVHSQRAVEYLGQFSLPGEVDLRVMHVLPPDDTPELLAQSWMDGELLTPMPPLVVEQEMEALHALEEKEGHGLLDLTVEALKRSFSEVSLNVNIDSVLLRGDAATQIIQYVKDNQIDLIVAGSRGLSQVRGWLLGSVSRKLIHYAGCSVLVIKGPSEVSGR